MKANPLTRLRYFIIDHYDLSELQILCHDLSIRYDMLGGDNRLDVKADRLLRKLGRQQRFDDLLALLRQTRREPFEQRKVADLKPEILEDALSGFVEEQSGEESTKLERSSSRSRNSDRYEIQEELGRGSFATVYKAHDNVLNRTVALKILHPHMWGAPGAVARFKPSEEQWEKAARGTDGRTYPWGDDWQDGRCNTEEAGIGSTTPVGQFSPAGDSPYGCVDMSGNVWEWTSSKADRLYRIKGGGHHSSKDAARSAAGYNLNRSDKYGYCGFRILSASTFSTSD